jgi:glycosyltransferase involved in cell wall biosynthesis
MKLLFALPGFHRYDRGAEVALLSVASELAASGDQVTVAGSGESREGTPYEFVHIPAIRRERFEKFPTFPPLRSETAWEDATFAAGLTSRMVASSYDATITCAFPFTHWALRLSRGSRPKHIFVTQNGDWPAQSDQSEYRFFHCEGLVCTNPDYFATNKHRWPSQLIPNGIDLGRFCRGAPERRRYGLPEGVPIILMVSAFIDSKRVLEGVRAVAALPDAFLAIAGDGPLRREANQLADDLLPGRYRQLVLSAEDMPGLYRSADAFLHLSLLESFGNVFLEAWASGLPIVGHDSDRLRWILGDDQFLCDTTDQSRLVQTLQQALKASPSSSRTGIERFAWPAVADQYRVFLQHVLAGSAGSS